MPSLQPFYGPDAAVAAQEARPSQHVSGYRVSLRMAWTAGALSHWGERGQRLTLGGHHTMTTPRTPLGDSCQKCIIRTCHVGTNPQGGTSTKPKACTPQKCQGHDTKKGRECPVGQTEGQQNAVWTGSRGEETTAGGMGPDGGKRKRGRTGDARWAAAVVSGSALWETFRSVDTVQKSTGRTRGGRRN